MFCFRYSRLFVDVLYSSFFLECNRYDKVISKWRLHAMLTKVIRKTILNDPTTPPTVCGFQFQAAFGIFFLYLCYFSLKKIFFKMLNLTFEFKNSNSYSGKYQKNMPPYIQSNISDTDYWRWMCESVVLKQKRNPIYINKIWFSAP